MVNHLALSQDQQANSSILEISTMLLPIPLANLPWYSDQRAARFEVPNPKTCCRIKTLGIQPFSLASLEPPFQRTCSASLLELFCSFKLGRIIMEQFHFVLFSISYRNLFVLSYTSFGRIW